MQWQTAVDSASYPNLLIGDDPSKHFINQGEVVVCKVIDITHGDDFWKSAYTGRRTDFVVKVIECKINKSLHGKVFKHYIRGKRRDMLLANPIGINDFLRITYEGKGTHNGNTFNKVQYDVSPVENTRIVEDMHPQGEYLVKQTQTAQQQQQMLSGQQYQQQQPPPPPPPQQPPPPPPPPSQQQAERPQRQAPPEVGDPNNPYMPPQQPPATHQQQQQNVAVAPPAGPPNDQNPFFPPQGGQQ